MTISPTTVKYLTPKEIAAETQLAYRTVLKEIHEGRLAATKLAGQIRVSRRDFDAWVQAGKIVPAAPIRVRARFPDRRARDRYEARMNGRGILRA